MKDEDVGFWQGLILAAIMGVGFYLTVALCFLL